MPYDITKDHVLDSWTNEETGLILSINRYGEGEPKLQIGPRTYIKKDGSKGSLKAGRLTIEDVVWLAEIIDDIQDRMNGYIQA